MAMQRVDIPKKFWNTRQMYIAECAFKVLVFTTLGPLGLLSGVRLLIFHLNLNCKLGHFFRDTDSIVCVVKNLFISPMILRLVIFGSFIVLLYPMMASRACSKVLAILSGKSTGVPPGAPNYQYLKQSASMNNLSYFRK